MLNWDLAKKIANQISNRTPSPIPYDDSIARDMEEMFLGFTPEAEALVEKATGFKGFTNGSAQSLPATSVPARSRVLSRADWIDANVKTFARMLRPLEQRLDKKLNLFTYNMGSVQIGVLLGWMSKRVLGQYDLLILEDEEPEVQDFVYYVGQNIANVEGRYGFNSEDFRFWIALHELTHRAQFTKIPWLRGHFLSLVEASLENVELDIDRIKNSISNIKNNKKRFPENNSLPYLLGSEEQIEIFEQLGGLMSLLEGHGEVMMDRAAQGHVADVDRFHRVMRQRRTQAKGLAAILQKLLGIETKLRQYEAGEKFVEELQSSGGEELLNRAWERPENLPSMNEIQNPQAWIKRVGSPMELVS